MGGTGGCFVGGVVGAIGVFTEVGEVFVGGIGLVLEFCGVFCALFGITALQGFICAFFCNDSERVDDVPICADHPFGRLNCTDCVVKLS